MPSFHLVQPITFQGLWLCWKMSQEFSSAWRSFNVSDMQQQISCWSSVDLFFQSRNLSPITSNFSGCTFRFLDHLGLAALLCIQDGARQRGIYCSNHQCRYFALLENRDEGAFPTIVKNHCIVSILKKV